MIYKFDKCEYCDTWHIIEKTDWGGILIKTCTNIPRYITAILIHDPNKFNPIPTAIRKTS